MPKIVRITPVESIQVGPLSTVLPDGTIVNPEPYSAVDIEFGDGVQVQVERPLTLAKITAAWKAAGSSSQKPLDGLVPGDVVPDV